MKQLNDINLKQLRKSRGFTQEQLGIIAGMTKSQVSKMERGLLGSDVTISRVLTALGYSTRIICIDSRGELKSERDKILDILKVFKINNSDKYGIDSLAHISAAGKCNMPYNAVFYIKTAAHFFTHKPECSLDGRSDILRSDCFEFKNSASA